MNFVTFGAMFTKLRLILMVFLLGWFQAAIGQSTTCAGAVAGSPLVSGSCLTGQNASTAVTAANCGGGFNSGVGLYYEFTAGTCPEFDITFAANEDVQFIIWSSSCTVLGVECSYAVSGVPLTESFSSAATPALTNGTNYVLEVLTDNASSFSICYNASQAEDPTNECSSAAGLSPSGATFYNGGNCSFTGSLNDASTSDPAASQFCAGSLENTQWVTFQPLAGASSFQIIGSGISCGGPVCAYQFGVFSGTCGSLTPEGCVSNGNPCSNGPDPNSAITTPAGGNNTYLLTWNSVSATGFTGTFTLGSGGTFTGTEEFYLAMDGNANSDCQYFIQGVNIQTLPMELLFFRASQYSNAVKLVWEVASELNCDYYQILRSADGMSWEVKGDISCAGTTKEQLKYSFMDETPIEGTTFYMLRQLDYDGTATNSKVISVNRIGQDRKLLKIVDFTGMEVSEDFEGFVIYLYDNGDFEKRMKSASE
jgi:hypothetical protein